MTNEPTDPTMDDVGSYRGYLTFLARTHVSHNYQGRLDLSDVVQQSLMCAFQARGQFKGTTEQEKLAWLRRILIRTIHRFARNLNAQKRDIKRERSIDHAIENSSMQLGKFLTRNCATPSQEVIRQESNVELAEAIESLPKDQRTAIILKYWQGLSLEEVSESMNKSIPAVAGLLHRARRALKTSVSK